MSLTPRGDRGYGAPLPVRLSPSRLLPLALALAVACGGGGDQRPSVPLDSFHYPADVQLWGDQLLVVSQDLDLEYSSGSVVAVGVTPAAASDAADVVAGAVLGGVAVPHLGGELLIVPDLADPRYGQATVSACGLPAPAALFVARADDALYGFGLAATSGPTCSGCRYLLDPPDASYPYGVALTCPSGGTKRAWVSYLGGNSRVGYLSQIDLSSAVVNGQLDLAQLSRSAQVEVNVGGGAPISFAYDPDHDRLFFTGEEHGQEAPLRWIDIGGGCQEFDDGLQDVSRGGCHVDAGFKLDPWVRGAEPREIAFSTKARACTSSGFTDQLCRRVYLSVRLYDPDLASSLGSRPSGDVGGMLVVLELPEEDDGLGEPQLQWVRGIDIGMIAGHLTVISRTGEADLVAVTATTDDLLWIYDDALGVMVKVFGRDTDGVPVLGHTPTGIAAQALDSTLCSQPSLGACARLFVTAFKDDDWVSLVDVPLAEPAEANLVHTGADPTLHTNPVLRIKGNSP